MNFEKNDDDKTEVSGKKSRNSNAIGKNLVIVSSLLILHNLGMIKLTSLPFIGAGLVASDYSITICIVLVSIYYCYKFWVYRKDESEFSRSNELSEIYINKIYYYRYKRALESIPRRLAQYNDTDVKGFSIEPVLSIFDEYESHYTRFDIAEFTLFNVEFDRIDKIKNDLIYSNKDTYKVTMFFRVPYVLYNKHDNSMSNSSVTFIRHVPFKEFDKYYKLARVLSKLRLPDFIESLFPYFMFFISMVVTITMINNGS